MVSTRRGSLRPLARIKFKCRFSAALSRRIKAALDQLQGATCAQQHGSRAASAVKRMQHERRGQCSAPLGREVCRIGVVACDAWRSIIQHDEEFPRADLTRTVEQSLEAAAHASELRPGCVQVLIAEPVYARRQSTRKFRRTI